ncbi:MAG: preprotein translocase subunit YajC [Gemmataceae bacterium]|nr:preprotein translocase subunit YajC [Gemmataceae bacterium]
MNLLLLLAQAQDGQPQQPPPMPGGQMMPLFLVGLVVLFMFIVYLPAQRRQKKEQEAALAAIKPGTKVLTNAGIVATVVSIKDGEDEIVIRSEDTKLRIKRNVVVQVIGVTPAEPAKQ